MPSENSSRVRPINQVTLKLLEFYKGINTKHYAAEASKRLRREKVPFFTELKNNDFKADGNIYKFKKFLGEGANGEVSLYECNGKRFAVKESIGNFARRAWEYRHTKFMCKKAGLSPVLFYQKKTSDRLKHVCTRIIMPYIDNSCDLSVAFHETLKSKTTLISALHFLQIISIFVIKALVEQMHAYNFVHGDVKINNFLAVKNERGIELMLIDFESIQRVGKGVSFFGDRVIYLAPECHLSDKKRPSPSFSQDVFSLGINFLMMLCCVLKSKKCKELSLFKFLQFYKNKLIYQEHNANFQENVLLKCELGGTEGEFLSCYLSIVKGMLTYNPKKRSTTSHVLERLERLTKIFSPSPTKLLLSDSKEIDSKECGEGFYSQPAGTIFRSRKRHAEFKLPSSPCHKQPRFLTA